MTDLTGKGKRKSVSRLFVCCEGRNQSSDNRRKNQWTYLNPTNQLTPENSVIENVVFKANALSVGKS